MSDDATTDKVQHIESEHEYGALFWTGTVLGWLIIAYGAKLLFDDPEASWFNTVRLVAIGIVAHDIVWLAISVGVGWLLSKALGTKVPYWIRWSGWTSAIVIAMWFPLWRGYGDRIRNDTILPRNYTASIFILLAVIWLAGGAYGYLRRDRT